MRCNIIGYGNVGRALYSLLSVFGASVHVYDPNVYPEKGLCLDVDISFICVPDEAVEQAVKQCTDENVKGLLVIKSTVPIGTTDKLMKKYNRHICHNPEFIRQRYATRDILNPDRIVIGECCKIHGEALFKLYEPLNAQTFLVEPLVSEAIKLVANAHLATLISFWNEIHTLSKKMEVPTHLIADAVFSNHRISKYGAGFFGQPFDGSCLPKDFDYLLAAFTERGLDPPLLRATKKINEALK